jgi:cytochrome c
VGVVGRKAGAGDFPYTAALKGSGLTWTPETLDRFLTDPAKVVPGTAMPISLSDAKDRQDLIAYLASLKGH